MYHCTTFEKNEIEKFGILIFYVLSSVLKQQTTSIMAVKVCVREVLPNPPREVTIGR